MSNTKGQAPPQCPIWGPIWELSTDAFAREDRFEAWHAAVSPFNDIRVSPEERPDFRASTSYWSVGNLVLVKSQSTSLQLVRTPAQAARDQLDHEVVVVFRDGASRTDLPDGNYALNAGDVGFANMRQSYDFQVTSPHGARWCELILPPGLSDRPVEYGPTAVRRPAHQTPQSRLLGQFICSVADQLPQLDPRDMPLIEQALLCLMAVAGQNVAGQKAPSEPARLSEIGRQTVDRATIVAMIEDELFSARLTVDRICTVAGVSRSALYRLFDADDGVASYVRMRRLDVLRGDLIDPRNRHRTVAQLSEERGFHSLSTLNRAFRRRFGCTPIEVRDRRDQPKGPVGATQLEGVITYLRAQGGA
jgi:AraC-like DNA-binding protein